MKKSHWTSKISRMLLMIACVLFCTVAFAQEKSGVEEVMRSNGKIYVVVAVCLTILTGLFLYVFLVDRKISKIEKEN